MKNSQKSIVTTLMLILVLGIGYFGAYGQWQKLADSRAQLQVSQDKNQELSKQKSDISRFVASYNNSGQLISQAQKALPVGDPDTAVILDNFSSLAAASGLNLSLFNILDSGTAAGAANSIQPVEVNMELFGSYAGFKNFLLLLQQNLRLSDIVNLSIDSSEQAQDGNNLQYGLRIRTYYQQ